jgi:hypothetical protein
MPLYMGYVFTCALSNKVIGQHKQIADNLNYKSEEPICKVDVEYFENQYQKPDVKSVL